jgi:hypothetical protein
MIKEVSQDTSRYIVASNHCSVEEDDGRIEKEIPRLHRTSGEPAGVPLTLRRRGSE